MWAVDLRQPKAWMENASDFNSVLNEKEKKKRKNLLLIAKAGLCLENILQQRTVGIEKISLL